jgi:hypothetical protein
MIRVVLQIEPPDFDAKVRQKGANFLTGKPNPTAKEFQTHAYWTEAIPDLMKAYKENCAYSGLRLWTRSQEATVDHYLSKVKHPPKAYEWSNFRLCSRRINGWKSEHLVIDPFAIEDGWFYLDFNDLYVKVNDNLDLLLKAKLENDIKILRLNDNSFVDYRSEWYVRYRDGEATFQLLERDAYFVAYELRRQGLVVL